MIDGRRAAMAACPSLMLPARVATAIVLLAACVAALLGLSNTWWAALTLPALLVAALEWAALGGAGRRTGWAYAALLGASAVAVWRMAAGEGGALAASLLYGAACVFWVGIAPAWLARSGPVRSPWLLALAGWIVLVPAWVALVQLQASAEKLLALLGVVWVADTAAYFCGRAWGRHRLAPTISPGKTWEGVAGAMAGVAVYYFVLSRQVPHWDWWQGYAGAVLFAGVATMSIVGDLFESRMKRSAGVKDSGTLLPGHGGVLDRIDSLTAALPVAAALILHAV